MSTNKTKVAAETNVANNGVLLSQHGSKRLSGSDSHKPFGCLFLFTRKKHDIGADVSWFCGLLHAFKAQIGSRARRELCNYKY
jgi:hypothetical protein